MQYSMAISAKGSTKGCASACAVLFCEMNNGDQYRRCINEIYPIGGINKAAQIVFYKALQCLRSPQNMLIWTDNAQLAYLINNRQGDIVQWMNAYGIENALYLDADFIDKETAGKNENLLLYAAEKAQRLDAQSIKPSEVCPHCRKKVDYKIVATNMRDGMQYYSLQGTCSCNNAWSFLSSPFLSYEKAEKRFA